MKFDLKNINWALILVVAVVFVGAGVVSQLLVASETESFTDEEGSTSITTKKVSIPSLGEEA